MESDKNWAHKPEAALNNSTKSMLAAMVVIFAILILSALFFLKNHSGA